MPSLFLKILSYTDSMVNLHIIITFIDHTIWAIIDQSANEQGLTRDERTLSVTVIHAMEEQSKTAGYYRVY